MARVVANIYCIRNPHYILKLYLYLKIDKLSCETHKHIRSFVSFHRIWRGTRHQRVAQLIELQKWRHSYKYNWTSDWFMFLLNHHSFCLYRLFMFRDEVLTTCGGGCWFCEREKEKLAVFSKIKKCQEKITFLLKCHPRDFCDFEGNKYGTGGKLYVKHASSMNEQKRVAKRRRKQQERRHRVLCMPTRKKPNKNTDDAKIENSWSRTRQL